MKKINQQKSKKAAYQDGEYLIINIEPNQKNGTWLVTKDNDILFASSVLTEAKKYVWSYTYYKADESKQTIIDKIGSLRKKLDRRLKTLELEMMSKSDFRKFLKAIPRVNLTIN